MAQDDGQSPGRPRELRLALAMRGGVSLAVWIGGTCCEIDKLRTAEPGTGFWGRLLDASGYDAVAVDVLAGASAGGLNGVIYAASQQYGFDMALCKDIWVDVGDTEKLLRTRDEAPEQGWPSLFKGDDYFYTQARDQLAKLAAGAMEPREAPPLALTLSATLVEPIRRPGRSPSDEQLTELRFGSGFTFRQPSFAWQRSDFPHGDQPRDSLWHRLALAGRTTSSFPVAFEAARIVARRPAAFAEATSEAPALDMGGVFQERGTPDGCHEEFLASDGGILDNIPLGRALDAIADAPAGRPTDRYLVYVQPGAPAPRSGGPAEQASLRRRRASFSVIRGLAGARLPAEDIIGDLEQLDDYNARIERAASLRRGGFHSLDSQDKLLAAAVQAWGGYRAMRAAEDQRMVSALLEDPVTVLREDPFPSAVGGEAVSDNRWRSPLDDPRGHGGAFLIGRERLAVALAEGFADRLPAEFPLADAPGPRVVQCGALPLLRICQLLIECAQHLEADAPEAGAQKERLYRVAAFLHDAIDRPRRLAWVALAATAPADATEAELLAAADVLTDLMLAPEPTVAAVCEALQPGRANLGVAHSEAADAALRAAVQDRIALVDQIPARAWGGAPPPEPGTDLRAAILQHVLVPIARTMQRLAAPAGAGTPDHLGGYLHRALDGDITAATLEALEVVAFPEFAGGLPGRRTVSFRRLSSANPTPLAPRFKALLEQAQDPGSGAWWDSTNHDPDQQKGIHVSLKLAGNELSNFSAFLRKEWRLNDWMWGRLDAVPTMVELLMASGHFTSGPQDPEEWRGWIAALVAGQGADASPLRDFLLQELLDDATLDVIEAELAVNGPAPTLQRVLVAARQWEILAEELLPPGTPDDGAKDLVEAVAGYEVGGQTLRSAAVNPQVRNALQHIADVGANVLVYCGQLEPAGSFLGSPSRTSFVGRILRRALKIGGACAASRTTKE
jgi:hypothetical protein